jgi:multidrug efflux pump subunit AcrB
MVDRLSTDLIKTLAIYVTHFVTDQLATAADQLATFGRRVNAFIPQRLHGLRTLRIASTIVLAPVGPIQPLAVLLPALAIGIVVDDALVVVENTERNMSECGLSPKEVAKRAMQEVSGPVIAIVLVLNAVFVPVAFLGGMTGQLFKQFAVIIAISVVFSGLVALTLSPALAALLLKPAHGEKRGLIKWFENTLERVTSGYVGDTHAVIRRAGLAFVAFAALVGSSIWVFSIWPSAFVPQEDQGYLFVPYFLPDAASLDRTEAVGNRAADFMMQNPAVSNMAQFDGFSLIDSQFKTNAGLLFVSLKDFEERTSPELTAPALIWAAARNYSHLAKLRYNEGVTSYIAVLDAQRSLFEAKLKYLEVQGDVYSSLVNTYKAMGGGWVIKAEAVANQTEFASPDARRSDGSESPARTSVGSVTTRTDKEY